MRTLQVVVIDDSPLVATTVEAWLAADLSDLGVDEGGQPFEGVAVWPYDTVEGFVDEISHDLEFEIDIVLVDLVLQVGGYGGLKALAAVAEHRPETPVLIFSALENNGDRVMYALAAAIWFTDQLRGIIPKVLGPGGQGKVASRFRKIVAGVLEGDYDDPTMGFLRVYCSASFTNLMRNRDDLAKWRAIQRVQQQAPALKLLGLSGQTLREWEVARLGALDEMWDLLAEHTEIGGTPGRFRPSGGDTHAQLREFIFHQHAFFADPYLDEHFAARA